MSKIAKQLEQIFSERQDSYGSPEDNFQRIADFWNAYIEGKEKEGKLTNLDVAHMLTLFKVARTMGGTNKGDNYYDLAGYAECGLRIYEKQEHEGEQLSLDIKER